MTHENKLARFVEHGKEFQDALAMVPEAYRGQSVDGGWSAAFVMHHMADGEAHFLSRYLHALGDENPGIVPFDEEAYPDNVQYSKRKVKTSLAAFVGVRAMQLEILTNATDADWKKTSNHPERGVLTLEELFEMADDHIVGHTNQLKEIAAKVN
jgi:DinB superfamily